MSPETIGLIGVGVLLVLLAFGTWIGMAMAIVGIAGVMIIRGVPQALTMSGSISLSKYFFLYYIRYTGIYTYGYVNSQHRHGQRPVHSL